MNLQGVRQEKKQKINENKELVFAVEYPVNMLINGKIEKLAQILEKDKMKDDINLKTAKNIMTVDIWSEKFLRSYNPSDSELKELFKAEKPILLKYRFNSFRSNCVTCLHL